MKLSQSTLFFIILAIALLATLGLNIKEGLTPDTITHTRAKEKTLARQRNLAAKNIGSKQIKTRDSGLTGNDDTEQRRERFWSERRGVRRVDIPEGDEDLYVLKSSIVPPVCPRCPQRTACPRQKPCRPCPPCARCPEPAFTCKKVPNYNSMNNQYLPLPRLSQASLNNGNTW